MRKGKYLEPDPDPYLWLMDPDPDPGEAQKHADLADLDPDPQHWLLVNLALQLQACDDQPWAETHRQVWQPQVWWNKGRLPHKNSALMIQWWERSGAWKKVTSRTVTYLSKVGNSESYINLLLTCKSF
jgi:hypothetical protein